jgi:hypothetical protein
MKTNNSNTVIQSAYIPLTNIGTIKAKDSAALAVTARKYSDAMSLFSLSSPKAIVYAIPAGANLVNLAFAMKANNSEAGCDIYLGWCAGREDSELMRVCSVAITAGQQTSVNSLQLADTLTITNNNWISAVTKAEAGTDHMALMAFDRMGADILVIHCHTTLTESEELSVLFTGV